MPSQAAATADIPPPPVLSQDQLRQMPGVKVDSVSSDSMNTASAEKSTTPNTARSTPAVSPVLAYPGDPIPGLVEQGNIDLANRPIVRNADGSYSTVRSMSFNEDGKEILIPTVSADGSRILSAQEAIEQYHRTGQFLGKFDTPANATAYGQNLHNSQAQTYGGKAQAGGDNVSGQDVIGQLYQDIVGRERSGAAAVSPKGAIGIGQIMPSTAAQYGVSREALFDPKVNEQVSKHIISDLWNKYHDADAVRVAYNAGPSWADRWLASGRDSSILPHETQNYLAISSTGGANIPYANEQQAAAQAIQADLYGASDRARKQADGFMSEVKDFKKDLAGSLQRIHEARGRSDEAIAKATEAANYQPKPPLIDGFANLGSLGAIIGMMGGLLTKSPMIASLNAGAAAIEAANRGDMAQYERAYDSWKTSSDMLFKIVDLQQKRAQEIMGDEKFMTEEKRVGLDLYLRAIHQEELANDIRIKGDQFGYEHFRNMGAAAEQYRKDQLQLEEFHARLNNQKTYDTPKNVEVLDAKGNSLWQGAAERDHQGNWTKSGSHDALPQGEIKLMPGNAMVIGSRENVLIQRSLVAGKEITSELSNLAQMNVSVSSGMFGGRQQGPSLFDASKEVLANTVTGQEVQLYNDSVAGLQRELAGLITGGVYINQETVNSFNQLTLKEGDTQLTKLHKMATIRQNTENALDALLVNPRVDKTQKEYARQQIKTLRHAIPWTPSDVIKLHNSQNPGISLKDLGIQMGLGGDAELPPEIPSGSKKTDKTIGGKAVYEATDGSFWTEN